VHPKEHFSTLTRHRQPGLYRIVSSASQRVHVARGDEFQILASLREKGRDVESGSQIYGMRIWVMHRVSFVFWMDAPGLLRNLMESSGTLVEDSGAAVVARRPLRALLVYEMVVL
jgi:hypothetical protein